MINKKNIINNPTINNYFVEYFDNNLILSTSQLS